MAKKASTSPEPDLLSAADGKASSENPIPQVYRDIARVNSIDLPADGIVAKKTLAALEGVTGAAVSKWIRSGKLDEALVGEGRRAKVNLALAMPILRASQNINQTSTQRTSSAAVDVAFAEADDTAALTLEENATEGGADVVQASATQKRLNDAKVRKAEADALFSEQKAFAETGEWITRTDHEAAVTHMAGKLVAIFDNLGLRIGEQLAGQFEGADQQAITVAVDKIVRAERQRFADSFAQKAEGFKEAG